MKNLTGVAVAASIALVIVTSAEASDPKAFYQWLLNPLHPIPCWNKQTMPSPHGPIEVPFFEVNNRNPTTTCTQSGPYYDKISHFSKNYPYYLQVVTDVGPHGSC